MKKIIYLLPFICFLQLDAQSYSLEQGKSDFQKNWNALTQDEQGNWWNLEMTTGSFSRSSFIMETFNVSETAIESGLLWNRCKFRNTHWLRKYKNN